MTWFDLLPFLRWPNVRTGQRSPDCNHKNPPEITGDKGHLKVSLNSTRLGKKYINFYIPHKFVNKKERGGLDTVKD